MNERLWLVTLAHNRQQIIYESLHQVTETIALPWEKVIVDHHWPKDYWKTKNALMKMARFFDYRMITPYENLGAHGGYTWALKQLPLGKDDFVAFCDSDVWPLTPGWDIAALHVLKGAADVVSVSLWHERAANVPGRTWKTESVDGIVITWPDTYSVTDITVVRASWLLEHGYPQGLRPFYGFVENTMFDIARRHGKRCVYLKNYEEMAFHPGEPDPDYAAWKVAHAHEKTFHGNFAEWLKR